MREGSAARTASSSLCPASLSPPSFSCYYGHRRRAPLCSLLSPPFLKFSSPLAESSAPRTQAKHSARPPPVFYPNTHFTLMLLCSWLFWRRRAVLAVVFLTFSRYPTKSAEIKDEQASNYESCFCRRTSIHPSFQTLQNKYHKMATALNAACGKLNELVCVCVCVWHIS